MANGVSGTFEMAGNGGFTLRIGYKETYTIESNQSQISITSIEAKSSNWYGFTYYLNGTIKIDGTTAVSMSSGSGSHPVRIVSQNTYAATSGSKGSAVTVTHDTDGSKKVTISVSVKGYEVDGDGGSGWSVSGSKEITLTTIARASTISAANADIGHVSQITVNRKSTSYTHSIKYEFEGLTGYIKADGTTSSTEVKLTATSIAFTVPPSFYAKIPSAKSALCTLTCTTYSGSTVIGTDTSKPRCTAAEANCAPTVSVSAYDALSAVVALTGSNKKVLKGVSKLHVDTTATGKNSATIKRIDVYNGSQTNLNANTSFIFANPSDSAEVRVVVTDSRGYQTTAYASGLTLVEYFKPTLSAVIARESPVSDVVKVNVTGKWFNASLGSVANTLTLEVRYKPSTQADYSDSTNPYHTITATKNGNNFTGALSLSGLDYKKSYDFRVRASDKVCSYGGILGAGYFEQPVTKGIPVAHWDEDDMWVEGMTHAMGGFEAVLANHRYNSDNDSTESAFETWLNNQLNQMDDLSVRDVAWTCYPKITGQTVCSKLYKHSGSYAALFGFSYDGRIYQKYKSSGTWQPCQVFQVQSQPGKLYIEAGDTLTVSMDVFAGYITTSATDLNFEIPLSKPCFASSVSITGTVTGRGIGGYINGTTDANSAINMAGASGYTVTTYITPGGIRVYVKFTSAITGATNNTPVSLVPRNELTLTFK